MSIGVIYTNNNITITKDGETKTLSTGDQLFDQCVKLWKEKDFDGLIDVLWSTKKIVEKVFKAQGFTVKDDVVFINNAPVVDSVGKKIINYAEKNKSPDRLVRFWERLKNNPSYWCVQSLFDFLDKNNCPIAEDGRFMALKCVRSNFTDKYSGTVSNVPGTKVAPFERNKVDDDKMKDCSFGYHVGSADYVYGFGNVEDKYIEVLVDPADVVSVPNDVYAGKVRVTTYEVVREIKKSDLNYEKYDGVYNDDNEDEDEDENKDNVDDEDLEDDDYDY